MIKRILLFFLLLQVLVVGGIIWVFANAPDGKLNWAQEAWRRMNDDNRQHCFDVVKESGLYGSVPSIKLLSGEESPQLVSIHYRINQSGGRFQEQTYECRLNNGTVDKVGERNRLLGSNFSDINTELFGAK